MNPSISTDMMAGLSKGMVIWNSRWITFAPSMEALSYTSPGIFVIPAVSKSILNGMPTQQLAMITLVSARSALINHSRGAAMIHDNCSR